MFIIASNREPKPIGRSIPSAPIPKLNPQEGVIPTVRLPKPTDFRFGPNARGSRRIPEKVQYQAVPCDKRAVLEAYPRKRTAGAIQV